MANVGPSKKRRKKALNKKPSKPAKKRAERPAQERHDLFARTYVALKMNGTRAYMEVYKCDEKTAGVNASKLLDDTRVQELIRKYADAALEKYEITSARVLEEIARMAFSNMEDYIGVNDGGSPYVDLSVVKGNRQKMAAIQEVTSETYTEREGDDFVPVKKTKIKLADKRANLDLLGKYLKVFSEGTPSPDTEVAIVLQKVLLGELTVRDAAYQLQIKGIPLPEVIKIELAKQQDQEPPEGNQALTPEQLEEKYQKTLKEVDKQKEEFVPQRQAEVAQLKEDMKSADSFSEDTKP